MLEGDSGPRAGLALTREEGTGFRELVQQATLLLSLCRAREATADARVPPPRTCLQVSAWPPSPPESPGRRGGKGLCCPSCPGGRPRRAAGGGGTHTPAPASLNCPPRAPRPAPRLASGSARSPFPPRPPGPRPRRAASRHPRIPASPHPRIPAAGPFPGSPAPAPDCARRGDSSRPFPVKPRQGKKINATFQRKL